MRDVEDACVAAVAHLSSIVEGEACVESKAQARSLVVGVLRKRQQHHIRDIHLVLHVRPSLSPLPTTPPPTPTNLSPVPQAAQVLSDLLVLLGSPHSAVLAHDSFRGLAIPLTMSLADALWGAAEPVLAKRAPEAQVRLSGRVGASHGLPLHDTAVVLSKCRCVSVLSNVSRTLHAEYEPLIATHA